MTLPLPSFLRRRLRLHEARSTLLAGEPEQSLRLLSDPCLALSPEADLLRERVLDVLCRESRKLAESGEAEESERLLELVAAQDLERARQWRTRIDSETREADGGPPSGISPAAESGIVGALGELLLKMRAEQDAPRASIDRSGPGSASAHPEPPPPPVRAPGRPLRFHLAVDDAGEFLVVGGTEVVIGHVKDERADLPILADIDSVHGRLLRTESFHGGPAWMIQPAQEVTLRVAGRRVPEAGSPLADGQVIELSPNLSFRFRLPGSGSATALLELLHGAECEGATRVLLFAQGEAGRVRMGARRGRHVMLRRTRADVSLMLEGDDVFVSSDAGLYVRGLDGIARMELGASEGPPTTVRVPCPPPQRVDVQVGQSLSGSPPFGFSLRGVSLAGSGEWGSGS